MCVCVCLEALAAACWPAGVPEHGGSSPGHCVAPPTPADWPLAPDTRSLPLAPSHSPFRAGWLWGGQGRCEGCRAPALTPSLSWTCSHTASSPSLPTPATPGHPRTVWPTPTWPVGSWLWLTPSCFSGTAHGSYPTPRGRLGHSALPSLQMAIQNRSGLTAQPLGLSGRGQGTPAEGHQCIEPPC